MQYHTTQLAVLDSTDTELQEVSFKGVLHKYRNSD